MQSLIRKLGSLRFSVVLLALSTLLVFLGTIDQANFGIHHSMEKYFNSWLVYSPAVSLISLILFKTYPSFLDWMVVPLPGGLTLGVLLSLNLIFAHIRYLRFHWSQFGILLIHGGLILLLFSGFLGSLVQSEWNMALDEGGEPVNHLKAFRGVELGLVNVTDPEKRVHHVVDVEEISPGDRIHFDKAGLTLTLDALAPNAMVERQPVLNRMLENGEIRRKDSDDISTQLLQEEIVLVPLSDQSPVPVPPEQQKGLIAGSDLAAVEQPLSFRMNETNYAAALVTVSRDEEILGTWLISQMFDFIEGLPPQTFESEGETYAVEMRFPRKYLPFDLTLKDFTHRRHPNTNIPAEFASDLTLNNPDSGENRHVRISMNEPLRYEGYTFYQASFANNDTTSVLQVVRNPGWQLPYISITVIGAGLIFHYLLKLLGFNQKIRRAEPTASSPSPATGV